MNWEKIMGLQPEALSQQQKEDLYETVAWCNPPSTSSKKCLIHFIQILQEILKYKSDQLDCLTNELDEIATRQGTEESNKLQQFRDEVDRLQKEIDCYRMPDKDNVAFINSISADDFKIRLLKLQNHNEELLNELSEKEKDLALEKKEVEKYASLLAIMEREKQEINRELKALKDEETEKSFRSLKNSPESDEEKFEALMDTIKNKNKHISVLLNDIENIEEENSTLRTNISAIKVELKETTSHISQITEELSKFRQLNMDYENREIDFKEKIKSLMYQIEELVGDKEKHDRQLDNYVSEFNMKIYEWKKVVESKDEEIFKLKEELKGIYNHENTIHIAGNANLNLTKVVKQQHEQIIIMQEELQKATEEINTSTELIKQLKQKQVKAIPLPKPAANEIEFFKEKIKVLEEKLKYAEEDARLKAEESSVLIAQIRQYESKVFGLSEAVAKIKKLENDIKKKDSQSEKLVDVCNDLELKINYLEEQNLTLREKLGLSSADYIDTSGIILRFKKNEEIICDLKEEVQKKEEELIQIKLMYRKIAAQIEDLNCHKNNSCCFKKIKNDKITENAKEEEIKSLDVKMNLLTEENDALRKGMHEILESIKNQNCFGNVQVQSSCLERLLEALDSRHISGWYHPAMRLQAQLNAKEGKNDELRNQIRFLKAENRKKSSELKNAYLKIKTLENDASTGQNFETKQIEGVVVENRGEPILESKNCCSFNTVQEQKVIEAESKFCKLKVIYDNKMVEIEKKEKSFSDVKEELLSKIEGLQSQVDVLKNENPKMINLMEMAGRNAVLNRKVNYLKALECDYMISLEKLKREFLDEEEKMLLIILKLQNEKASLVNELGELEKNMINLVPADEFVSVKKELESITAKYKCAVSLSLLEETKSNDLTKTEIELLESEKHQLETELKSVKEKLIIAEALIREETVTKGDFSNKISSLANKLVASESRELSEKQKALHLDKINDVLKLQLKELENRNNELMEKVVSLTEDNFKYQEVEKELRGQGMKSFLEKESHVFEDKIEILEKKIRELTTERDNIQELLEISQGQCRAFQEWKNEDKILLATQKEEILLLQASSDDKASISRLSHELAICKLTSSELIKKNKDLKMKLTKMLTQNLSLENRVSEYRREFVKSKKKHLSQIEFLFKTMEDVRNLYGCPVSFGSVESFYKKKIELKETAKKATENANQLKIQYQEYFIKKNELEAQFENLEDLKNVLKGDVKNFVFWHNKSSALRLQEAKYRRQNELLLSEVSQLKKCIERLNEEVSALEEENLERERRWEEKEALWEKNQLYVCQLIRENGIETNSSQFKIKDLSDATTNTVSDVSKEIMNIMKKKEELEVEKTGSPEKWSDNEEKEECSEELEKGNILSKSELSFYENDLEVAEKEALKMTIDSLQSVIKQKEETIVRYQDLLQKEREACENACLKLEKEVKTANDAFNVQSKAYNKLKNAVNGNNLSVDNVSMVVEKYITRIQELEEEVRMYQLNLSSINTQVHLSRQEVDKWHALAMERQSQLENMNRKMNADRKVELENCKSEIRNYESEIERLTRLLEIQQNDLSSGFFNENKEHAGTQEKREPEEKDIRDKIIEEYKKQTMDEVDSLRRQLKLARNESIRLRERIQVLESRPRKWSKTATPLINRCNSKAVIEKKSLIIKIKKLEESLMVSKEREKELMELSEKKLKSAEEVARWEEKKKSEQIVKNLNTKLKEKEAEVVMLINKNDNFRTLIHKFEKDKEILNSHFKVLKGNSTELNATIEKLKIEKKNLLEEVNVLKVHLEEEKRHSNGSCTALLHEKLEAQERKLMAYELASKGGNCIAENFEKLQILNSKLEKQNLKLESENLSLRLKLEKEKIGGRHFKENLNYLKENRFGSFEKCSCQAKEKRNDGNANGSLEINQRNIKIFLEKSLDNRTRCQELNENYKLLNEKLLEETK